MTDHELTERAKRVLHWHDWFIEHTETYLGDGMEEIHTIANALAYLWPVMLKGTQI